MKCPKCGYEQAIYDDINEWWHCPQCHGSGEVQMTEQEWLQTANTEQLAEFIIKVMLFYDNGGITMLEAIKKAVEDNEKLGSYFMESVLEWLKQPHRGGAL